MLRPGGLLLAADYRPARTDLASDERQGSGWPWWSVWPGGTTFAHYREYMRFRRQPRLPGTRPDFSPNREATFLYGCAALYVARTLAVSPIPQKPTKPGLGGVRPGFMGVEVE